MSQFTPEDHQGDADFVSDGNITFESDRNQDGSGDIVFRTGGVERSRIKANGSGTGWTNVLGGASSALAVHSLLFEDYGAKGDAQQVSDGAMTSASTTLTSATGKFAAGDVGKKIRVTLASASVDYVTTIAAYVSATQVTLTAAAPGTVAAAIVTWGTDDTAAWQAAIDDAYNGTTYGSGSDVVIRCGHAAYFFTSTPRTDRSGNAVVALPPARNGAIMRLVLQGFPGGTRLYSGVVGQSYSASFGPPSLIGGPTVEQTGKGQTVQFSGAQVEVYDFGVNLGSDPSIAGIDLGGITATFVDRVRITGDTGTQPTHIYAFGLRLPEGLNSGQVRVGYASSRGVYAGVVGNEAHIVADDIRCDFDVVGFAFTGNNQFSSNDAHSSLIKYLLTQECVHHVASWDPTVGVISLPLTNPARARILFHDIEDSSASGGPHWYDTVDHVLDANNQMYGEHYFARVKGAVGVATGLTVVGGANLNFFDLNGQGLRSRDEIKLRGAGLSGATTNWEQATNAKVMTSGSVYGGLVGLRAGDIITSLTVFGSNLGTGLTALYVGVYDLSGNKLAISADAHASLSATVPTTIPLAAPYTVPTDGACYLVVLATASTTAPTLAMSVQGNVLYTAGVGSGAKPQVIVSGKTDLSGSTLTFAAGNVTPFIGWS